MARHKIIVCITSVAATAAFVVSSPISASAASGNQPHHPTVKVLNSDVLAPFQLATFDHKLYVADGGTSQVSRVDRNKLTAVAHGPTPGEVAGVAFNDAGAMAFTSTDYATGQTALTIKRKGKADVVADLSGFETQYNPDANVTYGIVHPSQCVKDAFEPLGGATSKGVVDSHPYSVASLGNGNWVVADAGGNDLLKVDSHGQVSLLALMPRQPTVITSDIAAGLGLPDCVIGVTYNFEPVPTDVEVGPHGKLFVSLLPGGPEDPSLGARGSVYRVNQWNGNAHRLATGFLGATNVALDSHGTIYVAELFAGQISTIKNGAPQPYVTLPGALAVEIDGGHLYASTLGPTDADGNPTGPGSVVRIDR